MKALTLSIVIPAYNEEHQLEACLDSIAVQTVRPDEVILVDNNSTDTTVRIAKNYPFVKIVTEHRQGIVYARNKGFNTARSCIIGRIDADTVLPIDWVERVKDFYADEEHDVQALTGGGYFYNLIMPRLNGWVQSQFAYRWNRLITGHYILWGSNMALPRDVWRAVRDDVCIDDALHEDLDLAMHITDKGYSVSYKASLRVGVKLKRVWENQDQMARHLDRWPQSLRAHGYSLWWFGTVGNWIIWALLLFVRPLYNGASRAVRMIRWSFEPID
jgi:glycosyltransferase involved in cell wall biosynthesis